MSRTKHQARKRSNRKRAPESDAEDERGAKRQQQSQPAQRPLDNDYDDSIATMNPQLLADHVAKTVRRHSKDKTVLELQGRYLPNKAFLDTSTFDHPHNLQYLPHFLEDFAGGEANLKKSAEVASPHTLIICSSGIRAADVARSIRCFRTDNGTIAKMFAKHLKLKDVVEYVKTTRVGFGVGTPARINDVLEAEAIQLAGLERIVIDGSYLDEKKRTIFDMIDLFFPALNLLNREEIRNSMGKAKEISEADLPAIAARTTTVTDFAYLAIFEYTSRSPPQDVHSACLDLQHSATTTHNKYPFASLLLGPDNSTILLTYFGLGPVRHAECELARLAASMYSEPYLWACTLVSTWEPCAMCAGTVYWANIGRVLYAASEEALHKLTGSGNGENMTMSLPCREVLDKGQKDVEVIGPVKGWEERTVEESGKWWKEHHS